MRTTTKLLAIAGLFAIAACGKKHDDEQPVNDMNAVIETNAVENNAVAPEPMAEGNAVKAPDNRVAPPEISEQQQTQDDADATGMTSKLPEEYQVPPASAGPTTETAGQR